MDSPEIVRMMCWALLFPFDLVKTCQYRRQSRKLVRSRLQNPLAHRLRSASSGDYRREAYLSENSAEQGEVLSAEC